MTWWLLCFQHELLPQIFKCSNLTSIFGKSIPTLATMIQIITSDFIENSTLNSCILPVNSIPKLKKNFSLSSSATLTSLSGKFFFSSVPRSCTSTSVPRGSPFGNLPKVGSFSVEAYLKLLHHLLLLLTLETRPFHCSSIFQNYLISDSCYI